MVVIACSFGGKGLASDLSSIKILPNPIQSSDGLLGESFQLSHMLYTPFPSAINNISTFTLVASEGRSSTFVLWLKLPAEWVPEQMSFLISTLIRNCS